MSELDNGHGERRLLIVDDEERYARSLSAHLIDKGYSVRVVCSGEEAVALASVFQPNIVLLDLMMPGLGGVETLKALKQMDPVSRIVIISAADHDEVIRGALKLGADFYLCKPIKLGELDQLVHTLAPTLPGAA